MDYQPTSVGIFRSKLKHVEPLVRRLYAVGGELGQPSLKLKSSIQFVVVGGK